MASGDSHPTVHWPSVAQLAFSGLVLLGAMAAAAGLAVAGGLAWARSPAAADQSVRLLVGAAGLALVGLLALPSAGLALLRLVGQPLPGWLLRPFGGVPSALPRRLALAAGIAAVWAAALAAGNWAATQGGAGQLALAPLYVIVVALPIAGYLVVGAGGLSGGSLQRRWGIFDAGLAGTSLVVLVVEIVVFGLIGVAVVAVLSTHPDTMNMLNRLMQRLANGQITPENLGPLLRPFLQPWVIYLGVAIIAGLTPLIEELLKPLPLWLFARQGLTPAEGFVGGLLAGAGFALFESMGDLAGISGQSWAVSAAARAGTDLLHMVNAGLMGWALAVAWGQPGQPLRAGRYLRLALTYLLVVGIHGLWNSVSIVMVVLPLALPAGSPVAISGLVASLSLALLACLYIAMFIIMLWANHHLAPHPVEPVEKDIEHFTTETTEVTEVTEIRD
jgi:hypothetical protein